MWGINGHWQHCTELWPWQCFAVTTHAHTELHHYCCAVSVQGSGHLGSSCLLTLFSVSGLQVGWLSDVKLCSYFVLNRGVFGKQGYQCQGKVLGSCTLCLSVVLSQERSPCCCLQASLKSPLIFSHIQLKPSSCQAVASSACRSNTHVCADVQGSGCCVSPTVFPLHRSTELYLKCAMPD